MLCFCLSLSSYNHRYLFKVDHLKQQLADSQKLAEESQMRFAEEKQLLQKQCDGQYFFLTLFKVDCRLQVVLREVGSGQGGTANVEGTRERKTDIIDAVQLRC